VVVVGDGGVAAGVFVGDGVAVTAGVVIDSEAVVVVDGATLADVNG
jgi:hypothetical protein